MGVVVVGVAVELVVLVDGDRCAGLVVARSVCSVGAVGADGGE